MRSRLDGRPPRFARALTRVLAWVDEILALSTDSPWAHGRTSIAGKGRSRPMKARNS